MNQRTGGLTAICVVAIVVGSFGSLIGPDSVAALTFGAKLERAVAQVQPQRNSELQQAQQQAAAASARLSPLSVGSGRLADSVVDDDDCRRHSRLASSSARSALAAGDFRDRVVVRAVAWRRHRSGAC